MANGWWIAALGAAVTWGIHYPLIDKALDHLSTYTVLLITIIPLILIYPLFHTQVIEDIKILSELSFGTRAAILAVMITSVTASFLVYAAIRGSNATLASLIEITYPIFVVLFSYIILRENHLTSSVVLGGLLVIAGTGVIIWGNK